MTKSHSVTKTISNWFHFLFQYVMNNVDGFEKEEQRDHRMQKMEDSVKQLLVQVESLQHELRSSVCQRLEQIEAQDR